jgi:hypothetical protein
LQLADVDVTSSVTWKGPMHKPEMTPRPSVFVISTVFASQKLGIKEVDDAIGSSRRRRHLSKSIWIAVPMPGNLLIDTGVRFVKYDIANSKGSPPLRVSEPFEGDGYLNYEAWLNCVYV